MTIKAKSSQQLYMRTVSASVQSIYINYLKETLSVSRAFNLTISVRVFPSPDILQLLFLSFSSLQ